jgi:hypothetical protein
MPKKTSKDFDIDKYRQTMVTNLTVLKNDVKHIKGTMVDQRTLLREQNGRIRRNEKSISRIFGMGSVIVGGFSAFIAWLFNK